MTQAMALLKAYSDAVLDSLEIDTDKLPKDYQNKRNRRTMGELRRQIAKEELETAAPAKRGRPSVQFHPNVEKYRKQYEETGKLEYDDCPDDEFFEKGVIFVAEMARIGIMIIDPSEV